jgi:hypothetical protein
VRKLQFQPGAIKGVIVGSFQKRVADGFNSSLVRLKVSRRRSDLLLPAGFNSSLVRLKVHRDAHGRHAADHGFNSSLVRLKGLTSSCA